MKKIILVMFVLLSLNSFAESTIFKDGKYFTPNATLVITDDSSINLFKGLPSLGFSTFITFKLANSRIITVLDSGTKIELLEEETLGDISFHKVRVFSQETESIIDGYIYTNNLDDSSRIELLD